MGLLEKLDGQAPAQRTMKMIRAQRIEWLGDVRRIASSPQRCIYIPSTVDTGAYFHQFPYFQQLNSTYIRCNVGVIMPMKLKMAYCTV